MEAHVIHGFSGKNMEGYMIAYPFAVRLSTEVDRVWLLW